MAIRAHPPVALPRSSSALTLDPQPLVAHVVGARLGWAATVALAAVPVAALGLADGGYYPRPWGWAALGLSVAGSLLLLLGRRATVSLRPLVLLGLISALGVWIAASLLWTRSPGLTVFELQRLLVYLTGVGAAALLLRAGRERALPIGVFLGTSGVTVWGLVSYLTTREHASDVFQGAYLHRPMGYANAMAIASVLAILLGLGIVADSSSRAGRVAAAVALVPLASALALTGSRAAGVTFLVGLGVAVAFSPARSRTVRVWLSVLAVPAGAAMLVTAADPTNSGITGADANRLGEWLLGGLVALSVASVLPALQATRDGGFATRPQWPRWAGTAVTAGLVAAVVAVGDARVPNLAGERPAYWRIAVEELDRSSPFLGSGAGTFGQVWLEQRPVASSVHDAHSIVVESLSELGVVGLLLVLGLLGAPLVWGARARRRPLVPATAGAFAAYAAHASVDWDWELPAITLAALLCAVALGAAADGRERRLVLNPAVRAVVLGLASVAAALALVGFVGASAQEEATRALARGDAVAAERAARRAARWQPWAVDPLLARGRALLALGERDAARVLFARAAARDPNDYRAWLALAALANRDLREAAIAHAQVLNPRAVQVR